MEKLQLQQTLQRLTALLKRYAIIICAVVFGGAYAFLIVTAGQQAARQPKDEVVKSNSGLKLDASLASQLQELEDRNTELDAIFNEARKNPFNE